MMQILITIYNNVEWITNNAQVKCGITQEHNIL
jgi:hypothetical protein